MPDPESDIPGPELASYESPAQNPTGLDLPALIAEPPPEAAPSHAPIELESQERRDIALFVGRNPQKFLPVYDAFTARRATFAVCWPGVIFPQAWFLYRKMYAWAAFACVTPVFISNTHALGESARWLAYAPALAAFAGRRLYVAGARRTIARIRASSANDATARETIEQAGGVSKAGAVIGAVFFLSAVVIGGTARFHAGP